MCAGAAARFGFRLNRSADALRTFRDEGHLNLVRLALRRRDGGGLGGVRRVHRVFFQIHEAR